MPPAAADQHTNEAPAGTAPAAAQGPASLIVELSKPGIVRMVVISSAVGFALGSFYQPWSPTQWAVLFFATMIGTALSAAGSNALNQVMEVRRDSLMVRTAGRPIPSGRLPARTGLIAGVLLSIVGVALLAAFVNLAAAAVSAATVLSYLLLYTPSKSITPLSTLIGAIPGALPPLVGWAGAHANGWDSLAVPGGWSIVLLMFVWQVPHVMAISWKYRDDYAAGGYRVLPSYDPTGYKTGITALSWSMLLIPVSILPLPWVHQGQILTKAYALVALLAGGAMLWASLKFALERTDKTARLVFWVSVIYLPIVLLAMVADAFLISRL